MERLTRRGLLASIPWLSLHAASERGRVLPAEGRRYSDPATEFPVELFTDPQYTSVLPYPYARAIARKGSFFVFGSDRGSGMQAFRYELRGGEIRQITAAEALAPSTLNILPDDKLFTYIDGRSLRVAHLTNFHEREVYRIADDWELGEGFCVAGDGVYAALVEKQGSKSRLRLIGMAKGNVTTLVEHEGVIRHPQPRPRRASVLYQRDDSLCLVHYDGQNDRRLTSVIPSAGAAEWTPDGRTVLYLQARGKAITMRELTPDTQQDKLFSPTTQYINFSQNLDGSVIVAASGSLASPYVLLMLRSVKRELTVCEHKASKPAMVAPIFSPTSQRIYFQSDRHGKPAIYSVVVDKFIEKTES
jgi:oligogalacturonide lyase